MAKLRIYLLQLNNIECIFREEIEPIGDGPRFNPKGKADISGSLSGNYTITTDDFKREPVLQSI